MPEVVSIVGALYAGVSFLAASLVPLALVAAAAQRPGRLDLKLPVGVAIALGAWYGITTSVAASRGFASSPDRLPTILVGLLVPLAGGFAALWLVEPLRRALTDPNLRPILVAIQTYRLAGVGFLLLTAAGQVPAIFGIPAGLGDILVGLTAPGAAAAVRQGHIGRGVWWNALGLFDLALALTLGVATGPSALHAIGETTSQALSLFPLILVPSFVVPLDIWLHVVSLRSLLAGRSREHQAKPRQQMVAA
jgi:hypothetical protein